jgi:hypothetical protein
MQFKAEKLPELQFEMPGSRRKTSLNRVHVSRNGLQTVIHESKVQENTEAKYERELWRSELRLCGRIDSRRNWKRNVFLYQTVFSLYFQPEIIKLE